MSNAEAFADNMAGMSERIAQTFTHQTMADIGPTLTCREAEGLADILRTMAADPYVAADTAERLERLATVLLEAHATADDDPDDAHYAQYVAGLEVPSWVAGAQS